MTKKTTSTGFKYSIDEKVKTDWNFLKAIKSLQKNPSDIDLIEDVYTRLLTAKGFEDLQKHIEKKNNGYCPLQQLMAELEEIIKGENEIKK